MGQVRHESATTIHALRAAIQRSKASLTQVSNELGIKPKTVARWRRRQTVEDLKSGPREPRSTVLTEAEEATIVAKAMKKEVPTTQWILIAGNKTIGSDINKKFFKSYLSNFIKDMYIYLFILRFINVIFFPILFDPLNWKIPEFFR